MSKIADDWYERITESAYESYRASCLRDGVAAALPSWGEAAPGVRAAWREAISLALDLCLEATGR